jgi:hypothetical protein
MPVFVFRSEKDRHQLAFTSDKAGESLPARLGPWHRTTDTAMSETVGLPDSVQTAIRLKGYILLCLDPVAQRPRSLFRRHAAV